MGDIEPLLRESDTNGKLRLDISNSPCGDRKIRAYNGHSVRGVVIPLVNKVPVTHPFVIHGASVDDAPRILSEGVKLARGRADFHFVDAIYIPRDNTITCAESIVNLSG